ncbi:glycine/sarcosine/betaine reductase complex component C subunit beta [Escherichia fergusonii]
MGNAVIRQAGYILAHTPDLLKWHGSAILQARHKNPDEPWLSEIPRHLRSFDQAVNYPPHQCFIGNISPAELETLPRPWLNIIQEGGTVGTFGEIYSESVLYGMLCFVDAFDLTVWQESFVQDIRGKLADHPTLASRGLMDKAVTASEDELALLVAQHAAPLWYGERLVGCVKAAHDLDINLSAHVMLENLVTKASAVLAGWHISSDMLEKVEYVIECSEEAIGDVNQRGGGNLAKAVAESLNCLQATGIDMRGFCAGPVHALVNAAALVKSGVYKHVLVLAGGSVAKLGMNGRDHIRQGLPLMEDVLGGFALLISEDDGVSPVINTHVVGRHTVGTGASPQAVMGALISQPLKAVGMTTADVDKYSAELQNPEITQPAGAGNVPESNYKMIAALSVMEGWLERSQINEFVARHGMPGFAPTQGHIPSGVPFIGHGLCEIADNTIDNFMVVGKGSLFLGRMTSQFDGISVLVERNQGIVEDVVLDNRAAAELLAEAMRKVADELEAGGWHG